MSKPFTDYGYAVMHPSHGAVARGTIDYAYAVFSTKKEAEYYRKSKAAPYKTRRVRIVDITDADEVEVMRAELRRAQDRLWEAKCILRQIAEGQVQARCLLEQLEGESEHEYR